MAALEAGTPSTVASTNGDSGKYIIYEIIVGLVESSNLGWTLLKYHISI